MEECRVRSSGSGKALVAGTWEHENGHSGFVRAGHFRSSARQWTVQWTHLSEPEPLTLPGSRGGPGPRCTRDEGPQGEASFPEEAAA